MKNEEIDELITTVQNVPIVKKFYELKKEGKCPRILVHQVEGKDEIDYARLQLPEIDLYFHNSGSEKVEKIESETMSGKKLTIWSIPFDGWETT